MAILLVRTQASGAIWGAPMRPHRPAAGMAAYGLHLAAGCVMWKSDVFDAVAGLLRNTLLGRSLPIILITLDPDLHSTPKPNTTHRNTL